MTAKTDSKGNCYVDVGNVRMTYVKAQTREPALEWAGADVLRIQAYRNDTDASLRMGPELFLSAHQPDALLELIAALCALWKEANPKTVM